MKLKDLKNEIKVLDIAALVNRAKALKIELNDLVLDKNINKLKNLKTISKKRKEMARVLTAFNQKLMIEALEPKQTKEEVVAEKKEDKKMEKTEKGGKK